MLKANGYKHYRWSTACKSDGSYRFYPIFDWHFRDVWKYIADAGLSYNRVYDRMFLRAGKNLRTMRVSNLIHEQSFHALSHLQEFEPDTYDRLVHRLQGVHCAANYANENFMFRSDVLPDKFGSWRDYRNHLLETTPTARIDRFRNRFAKQGDDEVACQHQVKQLLLNDWEGNLPNTRIKKEKLRQLWWDRL